MSPRAWTPRRAVAASVRQIESLKKAATVRLDKVALEFADEDEFLVREAELKLQEIHTALDDLAKDIRESVEDAEREREA